MIDEDEIRAVAENARLDLADDEVAELQDDFQEILATFQSLDDIDTEDVDPAFHPIDLDDGTREDTETACLTQDEALSNTENKEDGRFKGPRAV